MRFYQNWQGVRIAEGKEALVFPAMVPGNIQEDYARAVGICDVMYGENVTRLEAVENDVFEYRATLDFTVKDGERVFFVAEGVDYKYDVLLNGQTVCSYEGMFKACEVDLTESLRGNDALTVRIYPHPKREGAFVGTRDEADASCKPAVSYGWDWNPRLLISGMWRDAYIETRGEDYIGDCEPLYTLSRDFGFADITFNVECKSDYTVTLYDAEGRKLYSGDGSSVRLNNPKLGWCNGQGEPYLYKWEVECGNNRKSGSIGIRRVRLLRNIGADDPSGYPKGRYAAPITLELNGRRIFMKGANYVNPDIFWGRIDEQRYRELVTLAKDGNMNIFRIWGGAAFNKEEFYRLCDEAGIMLWQEFPLACNSYPNEDAYLNVLEEEATALILALRRHPSVVLWCGGNELFNGWSGMSDQSLPLRLLDSLCYNLDRNTPFLATSPLEGMGHGNYVFYDWNNGTDVFENNAKIKFTAYTEFGVPSISPMASLAKIIPEDELGEISDTPSWRLHHAVKAWRPESHACVNTLEKFFGEGHTTEQRIEESMLLQGEGLKAIYELARRQSPYCSAAIAWCFNEPWITAANCSIVSYPACPKPSYYEVKRALRPVLFSAAIPKFSWRGKEKFSADIWLLNDTCGAVSASVEVLLRIGEKEIPLANWSGSTAVGENRECIGVRADLPNDCDAGIMTLVLRSDNGELNSEYRLKYTPVLNVNEPKGMNM